MLEEAQVVCPWCWAPAELQLDLSAGNQDYVEDCSVCCHPMRVMVQVDTDGSLLAVEAEREGD